MEIMNVLRPEKKRMSTPSDEDLVQRMSYETKPKREPVSAREAYSPMLPEQQERLAPQAPTPVDEQIGAMSTTKPAGDPINAEQEIMDVPINQSMMKDQQKMELDIKNSLDQFADIQGEGEDMTSGSERAVNQMGELEAELDDLGIRSEAKAETKRKIVAESQSKDMVDTNALLTNIKNMESTPGPEMEQPPAIEQPQPPAEDDKARDVAALQGDPNSPEFANAIRRYLPMLIGAITGDAGTGAEVGLKELARQQKAAATTAAGGDKIALENLKQKGAMAKQERKSVLDRIADIEKLYGKEDAETYGREKQFPSFKKEEELKAHLKEKGVDASDITTKFEDGQIIKYNKSSGEIYGQTPIMTNVGGSKDAPVRVQQNQKAEYLKTRAQHQKTMTKVNEISTALKAAQAAITKKDPKTGKLNEQAVKIAMNAVYKATEGRLSNEDRQFYLHSYNMLDYISEQVKRWGSVKGLPTDTVKQFAQMLEAQTDAADINEEAGLNHMTSRMVQNYGVTKAQAMSEILGKGIRTRKQAKEAKAEKSAKSAKSKGW